MKSFRFHGFFIGLYLEYIIQNTPHQMHQQLHQLYR
ncbi:MAG: hypothetical protein ACI94Y_000342 [Maribacter sp.]|jgi:hypothetical protein